MSKSNVIPHNWDVPKVFRDRLGTHAGRQRTMAADGHILIIAHDVPKPGVEHAARLYWRKPDGTWKSTGSSAATIGALRGLLEDYQAVVDKLEERAAEASRAAE